MLEVYEVVRLWLACICVIWYPHVITCGRVKPIETISWCVNNLDNKPFKQQKEITCSVLLSFYLEMIPQQVGVGFIDLTRCVFSRFQGKRNFILLVLAFAITAVGVILNAMSKWMNSRPKTAPTAQIIHHASVHEFTRSFWNRCLHIFAFFWSGKRFR